MSNCMHHGDRRALPSQIYPIKYLHEPLLPYDSLLDNITFLISTLSILIGFLDKWKLFLIT